MSQTTALTTQTQALSAYTGRMVSETSFEELNQIIDKIASNKEELTDGMRVAATQYADDWNKLVVERLNDKKDKLEKLYSFFKTRHADYRGVRYYLTNHSDYFYDVGDPNFLPALLAALKTIDNQTVQSSIQTFEELAEEVTELENSIEAERPVIDSYLENEPDMTFAEKVIAQKQFELDKAKFEKTAQRKRHELRIKFVKAHEALITAEPVKEFIKILEKQIKMTKDAVSVASEKASLVKVVINFGGTQLLSYLQELNEFQKTI